MYLFHGSRILKKTKMKTVWKMNNLLIIKKVVVKNLLTKIMYKIYDMNIIS
jgi:hypothetical protein